MVGGESGPVGVVDKPKAGKEAVVAATAPARRNRYAGFPWESQKQFDVPFSARTYTFSWVDGALAVLPQDWVIKKDDENQVTKVTAYAPEGDDPNTIGFPVVNYTQAKAMQDMSSKTGCSLKVAFAKIVGTDNLSKEDLDRIALAPDKYARPSQEATVERSKAAIRDEFFKAVNG